jgi:hypothetical protein
MSWLAQLIRRWLQEAALVVKRRAARRRRAGTAAAVCRRRWRSCYRGLRASWMSWLAPGRLVGGLLRASCPPVKMAGVRSNSHS